MLPILTRCLWIALWFRYLKLGWRLRHLAAGRRSEIALIYLGATTLLRSNPRLMQRPVRLSIHLGRRTYPIALKTRTELDILEEVALEDEYRPADAIAAKTIVDLGASVGLATLRLLAGHPGAQVISVEADPMLIPRLRANVAGLPVSVVHAAISASSGERSFHRSDIDSWANSLDNTSQTQTAVTVPALSLGDLLDAHGVDRVDLLKLDVEGAEWEIFEDLKDERIAAIVGEAHLRGEKTPAAFVEQLAGSMQVEPISMERDQGTFLARQA
jgi:FkbM family methyltransferase